MAKYDLQDVFNIIIPIMLLNTDCFGLSLPSVIITLPMWFHHAILFHPIMSRYCCCCNVVAIVVIVGAPFANINVIANIFWFLLFCCHILCQQSLSFLKEILHHLIWSQKEYLQFLWQLILPILIVALNLWIPTIKFKIKVKHWIVLICLLMSLHFFLLLML